MRSNVEQVVENLVATLVELPMEEQSTALREAATRLVDMDAERMKEELRKKLFGGFMGVISESSSSTEAAPAKRGPGRPRINREATPTPSIGASEGPRRGRRPKGDDGEDTIQKMILNIVAQNDRGVTVEDIYEDLTTTPGFKSTAQGDKLKNLIRNYLTRNKKKGLVDNTRRGFYTLVGKNNGHGSSNRSNRMTERVENVPSIAGHQG